MADGEIFEGDGEGTVTFSEDLFDEMQAALSKLVRSYKIGENELQRLLNVISQLWDLLDKTTSKCDKYEDQKKDLEEIWNEEKDKRRQAEKKKTELENRLDEERYQWQSEKQELQRDRVGLMTRIKQLEERNKELMSDIETQSEQFEQDQKLRNDLVEQYKKQYEIAKTSTLKRKKNKTKQTPGYRDYSTSSETVTTPPYSSSTTNPLESEPVLTDRNDTSQLHTDENVVAITAGQRHKRQLPVKNTVSLKTELKHPKGADDSNLRPNKNEHADPESFIYQEDEEKYYEIETQEEMLTSGPEILVVPTVAEVDMLKRQQNKDKTIIQDLQRKVDLYREEKDDLESNNAQLSVDVESLQNIIGEYQNELALLRAERDEILETYLDQPFDVYCVTKKELHEVLKKLHDTQMEMQKQSEEKQSLEMQLLARRKKKSPFRRFAKRFKAIFQSKEAKSNKSEEYEIVEPAITSYHIPPEAPYSPKSAETIQCMENFHVSNGWLVSENGPSPSTLPSLYCQVMLKEYHVTDAISCMCLARVYHTTQPLVSRKASLLPLAARTAKGRLCAEVWIGSNEGPTTFMEIIDVLSKRVVDRFLIRGNKITCMESVSGTISSLNSKNTLVKAKNMKQGFDESLDLFATDDKALEKEKREHRNSCGKSEVELRHYYKSRLHGRKSTEITDKLIDSINPKSTAKRQERISPLAQGKSDSPDTSLANEILDANPENESMLIAANTLSYKMQHSEQELLEDSSSIEVFTDDEGNDWQTSTPTKDSSLASKNHEQIFMWVAPDANCIHLFNAAANDHRPVKTLNLPSQPSCIRHVPGKVCVGLSDSRLIIYHQETIVPGGAWDIDNPSYVELPKLNPENPLPVRDIKLIRKKLWITTGSFLTLLDPDILTSQGSKFLDANQSQPNKLLPLDDVVLASTVKGANIYLLDPDRAEVIKRINISPASLILDNLLQLTSVNVTNLINDESNVYISTSTGKIFALPLPCFAVGGDYENRFIKQASMPDPNDVSSASYPPSMEGTNNPLFKCTASSLLTHREGSIRGLVHIPLPENITLPMLSNSNLNLSTRSSGLLSASSMPSLISDSPPLHRSVLGTSNASGAHPVFRSLLVSCGKGYVDYLSEANKFEGSTALREKNEAFQVMVWGYTKHGMLDSECD